MTSSAAAVAGVITTPSRPMATVGRPMPEMPLTSPARKNATATAGSSRSMGAEYAGGGIGCGNRPRRTRKEREGRERNSRRFPGSSKIHVVKASPPCADRPENLGCLFRVLRVTFASFAAGYPLPLRFRGDPCRPRPSPAASARPSTTRRRSSSTCTGTTSPSRPTSRCRRRCTGGCAARRTPATYWEDRIADEYPKATPMSNRDGPPGGKSLGDLFGDPD
jgi:hypothetical protein